MISTTLDSPILNEIKNFKNTDETLQILNSLLYASYSGTIHKTFHTKDQVARVRAHRKSKAISLAKFNSSRYTWEGGWIVEKQINSELEIRRNNTTFTINCQNAKHSLDVNITKDFKSGDSIFVQIPSNYLAISPGFFMFSGEAIMNDSLDMRFYLNIDSNKAHIFVEKISTALNSKNIPFKAKVNVDDFSAMRSDSSVIYCSNDQTYRIWNAIRDVYSELPIRSSVPFFTKKILDGISIAVDPKNGESFGQYICNLMAQSIQSIERLSNIPVITLASECRKKFISSGIDPENVWALHDKSLPDNFNAILKVN